MYKTAFILFATLCYTISFAQTNYYVSTTGSNSNNGSISNPWLSIQYACDQLQAGDTLNVLAGYYNEIIELTNEHSGTSENFTTLRNYHNDEVTITAIDLNAEEILGISDAAYLHIYGLNFSENNDEEGDGIKIVGTSHHITLNHILVSNINHNWAIAIKLENQVNNINIMNTDIFQINAPDPQYPNKGASGISIGGSDVDNPIHHINISNCKIHDCKLGDNEALIIYGNVSDFLIEDCELYNLNNIALDLIGGWGIVPVDSLDQVRYGIVRNCKIHDCVNPEPGYSADGFYIDGGRDILLENNISYRNDLGFVVWAEYNHVVQKNIILRNNVAFDSLYEGIAFGSWGFPDHTGLLITSSVTGNTLYNNNINNQGAGELYFGFINDCVVENNIIFGDNLSAIVTLEEGAQNNLTLNHNIYYTPNGQATFVYNWINYVGIEAFRAATNYESYGLEANPLFADIENHDFHLRPSSPAIDAGNPNYFMTDGDVDMDGEARIYNYITDCGADEYYISSNINSTKEEPKFIIYPNPAKDYIIIDNKNKNSKKVEIINTTGKIVNKFTINNKIKTISISKLNKGLYFIRVGNEISKFIKE